MNIERIERWYADTEKRTQMLLEKIADSGYAFAWVAAIAVTAGIVVIKLTMWIAK